MKSLAKALACCALALPCTIAVAQPVFEKPDDAIAYRQSALKLLGAHFSGLAPMMRGRVPFNAEQAQQEIAVLRSLSALPWKAFGEGTEGGNARPAVWQDSAKFQQAAKDLEASMGRLVQVSGSGDFDSIRAAYGDVANSCKACHDSFRQRR